MNILKEQKFLFDVALKASERSSGRRLKVGAVVADQNYNLIAYGYNGSVHSGDNNLEYSTESGLVTKPSTIHAEMNCIAHAARRGISVNNGIFFVTHSPCMTCTGLLIQSGISKIYYGEKYRLFHEVEKEFSRFIHMEQFSLV